MSSLFHVLSPFFYRATGLMAALANDLGLFLLCTALVFAQLVFFGTLLMWAVVLLTIMACFAIPVMLIARDINRASTTTGRHQRDRS